MLYRLSYLASSLHFFFLSNSLAAHFLTMSSSPSFAGLRRILVLMSLLMSHYTFLIKIISRRKLQIIFNTLIYFCIYLKIVLTNISPRNRSKLLLERPTYQLTKNGFSFISILKRKKKFSKPGSGAHTFDPNT